MNFKDRLFTKIEIRGDDECWPYIGGTAVQRNTYGHINISRDLRVTAPRAVLMVMLGRELRPGMHVIHLCHRKPCCNPRHLMEGTPSQNAMTNPPEVRALGGAAGLGGKKNHGDKQRTAQFTSRMRECSTCGLKTNAGTMVRHQNATGHGGKEIKKVDGVRWTPERRAQHAAQEKKTCECGMSTYKGQMTRHLKATGHKLV